MARARIARVAAGGSEAGNIILEMVMVLPVLLLVVAGIIDLGTLYWEKQILTNAAGEGARVAARAAAGGTAAQSSSQIRQIVQDQLDRYNLKDASGSRIVLAQGGNFDYDWNVGVTPVQLWVEIKDISVPMLLLSDALALFGGGSGSASPTLQAKTTVAAEWSTPPP
jgi:Flp pilus assembly protein TadG